MNLIMTLLLMVFIKTKEDNMNAQIKEEKMENFRNSVENLEDLNKMIYNILNQVKQHISG